MIFFYQPSRAQFCLCRNVSTVNAPAIRSFTSSFIFKKYFSLVLLLLLEKKNVKKNNILGWLFNFISQQSLSRFVIRGQDGLMCQFYHFQHLLWSHRSRSLSTYAPFFNLLVIFKKIFIIPRPSKDI